MQGFRRVVLWLFVLNLGIAFGAGLYEARVAFPQWLVRMPEGPVWNAAAARATDSGLRFWVFVSTLPLTLLTILNLVAAGKADGTVRREWLVAGGLALAERVLTFAYFIPTMIALMAMASSPEAVATAVTWERMNVLRHLLNFGAWIAALRVLSKMR